MFERFVQYLEISSVSDLWGYLLAHVIANYKFNTVNQISKIVSP